MRMNKYSLAVSCLLAMAAVSNAAHWELISRADTNYPSPPIYSDSDVTRVLTYRSFNAAVPSDVTMIYGSGTFPFYGEQCQMKPTYSGGATTWAHQDYLDSYYEFKFKWVSDSPSDTPPSLTTSVAAYGYSLERAVNVFFSHALNGGPWSFGMWSISMTFPIYGPVWQSSGPTNTFGATVNNSWPQSGGSDITVNVPNIGLMYIRPQVVGGGGLSLDGSGNTIATISVLNSMVQEFSIPITTTYGISIGVYVEGDFSCYKTVTQMLGLNVNY